MIQTPHPFKPIVSEERLQLATEYLAEQTLSLARAVLHQTLSLDTLCFFAHTPNEQVFLESAMRARGPESRFTHGVTLYVDTDFMVHGQHIRIFGVRQADATRPQVGYGDYPVADYEEMRTLAADNSQMTEITSGRGQSLIELRHPDFDVLGFIVDQAEH